MKIGICDICLKITPVETFNLKEGKKWKNIDICMDCGKELVKINKERSN